MSLSRRAFLKTCGVTALGGMGAAQIAGCSAQSSPSPFSKGAARLLIEHMTLEQKLAQLFVVTPDQLLGPDAISLPKDAVAQALASTPVSGLAFFGEHLKDARQTNEMLARIKHAATDAGIPPLFLCVDEEGGQVQRVGGKPGFDAPRIDHASNIGATKDPNIAREAASAIAHSLLDLGFTVDFAPTCDVSSGPGSMMHKRSFSTDAAIVAEMAVEEIREFEAEGLICCAKHFPGIGDPQADSHEGQILSSKSHEELEAQLLPFRRAIEAGVPLVMMGHLSLPAITGSMIPASLAPEIVRGLLREELGFAGVIITDSLGMGAIGEYAAPEEVAVAAVEAGCDVALMPPDFPAAYDGLLNAVMQGRISQERIDSSLERILVTKLTSMKGQPEGASHADGS